MSLVFKPVSDERKKEVFTFAHKIVSKFSSKLGPTEQVRVKIVLANLALLNDPMPQLDVSIEDEGDNIKILVFGFFEPVDGEEYCVLLHTKKRHELKIGQIYKTAHFTNAVGRFGYAIYMRKDPFESVSAFETAQRLTNEWVESYDGGGSAVAPEPEKKKHKKFRKNRG